jgi:uracil-DNA glycosylase
MIPAPPFAHTSGSRKAKIVFVGEAWGEQEEKLGKPFVGYSGQLFFRMLGEVWNDLDPKDHAFVISCMGSPSSFEQTREQWLERAEFLFTNVFAFRPENNNIKSLCGKKADMPSDYMLPPIEKGFYVKPEFLPELDRLQAELVQMRPNLVVALGNVACWALIHKTTISALRGTTMDCAIVPGLKVLPTYHPAAIGRMWAWRPVALADLYKARNEARTPAITRPERHITVHPTIDDISAWYATNHRAPLMAVDIETNAGQITDIGFATSAREALVITFVDYTQPGNHFWPTEELERDAWGWVDTILSNESEKIFQNGLYDLQYLTRIGMRPRNLHHDTMLLHHSIHPEMKKSLGFMGSIYTSEPAWKLMRLNKEKLKADE